MQLVFLVDVPPGCMDISGVHHQLIYPNMGLISLKQPEAKRYRIVVEIPANDGADEVIKAIAEQPGSFAATGVKDEG